MTKSIFNISSIIRLSVYALIVVMIVSCRNNFEQAYTLATANDRLNKEKQKHERAVEDIFQFLISAAEINREEIQMGQLAQQKGNNKFIRELGMEMEAQQTTILKDLIHHAEKREIYLHSQYSYYAQNKYQQLTNASSVEFDKAYCDWIITSQQESIALFDEASHDTTDLEINAWAKDVLQMLRKQLVYAIACQKKIERV